LYGHQYLNRLLQSIAYEVTLFLESDGYMALPFPPTISGIGGAEISHRHIAVAAGLGAFGWAGYVLTPQYGARQRFVSVITAAPLIGDAMYDGPSLCVPDSCSFACVKECPMDALDMTKEKTCRIGDRNIAYTWIDRWRCSWAVSGLTTKVGGFKEISMPSIIDEEALDRAIAHKDPAQIRTEIQQGGHATYCGKCQTVCPVGTTGWGK
jgi:ferredoxin